MTIMLKDEWDLMMSILRKQVKQWKKKRGMVPAVEARENPKMNMIALMRAVESQPQSYRNHYYCRRCGKWISKGNESHQRNGATSCPTCGIKVRTKPRSRKWRNHIEKRGYPAWSQPK